MHKEKSEQFRSLDAELDWPFFDEAYPIPHEKKECISPLTESASKHLWRQEVSSEPTELHLNMLPVEHWARFEQEGPNWVVEWNSDAGDGVQQFLVSHFRLPLTETVYFMLSAVTAYAVPIAVFSEYWRPFLAIDDEAPLLLHPASGLYAYFGPNGTLHSGRRG